MALRPTVPRSLPMCGCLWTAVTGHAMREQEERERQRIHRLQASYPGMKLWRKIDLRDFGASRQIRFGHLMGTEEWQICYPPGTEAGGPGFLRPHQLSDRHRSFRECAVGSAENRRENAPVLGKISADLPCQVYDIDGDGYDEVITAKNFEILILDGRTGEIKKSAPTPFSDEPDERSDRSAIRGVRL